MHCAVDYVDNSILCYQRQKQKKKEYLLHEISSLPVIGHELITSTCVVTVFSRSNYYSESFETFRSLIKSLFIESFTEIVESLYRVVV